MKKILLSISLIVLLTTTSAIACTTAVISGKYTKDGKPMLWKHRDSDFLQNKLMYFSDGKYDYIGLINTKDIKGEQVWAGTNSAGFSIMNAALFDVNLDYEGEYKDREGYVMKQALQQCASLDDFEKFLENLETPKGVAASFGVIDANGGAAYYETDNNSFTKFDANDPRVAPNGYLIRTNYAFTGSKDKGYGYIRFESAQDLFAEASAINELNYQTVIKDFTRSFYHSLLKTDFRKEAENNNLTSDFINSGDLICRNGSSSAAVIQGVKKGDSPDLTTMWTLIGLPFTTVAVPTWVKGGEDLPKIMLATKDNSAPLADMAMQLRNKCYPIERASGYKYLKISELINSEGSGITQRVENIENLIFKETEAISNSWNGKVNKNDIQDFYKWLDEFVIEEFQKNFF